MKIYTVKIALEENDRPHDLFILNDEKNFERVMILDVKEKKKESFLRKVVRFSKEIYQNILGGKNNVKATNSRTKKYGCK